MYLSRGNNMFSSFDLLFCYWEMELELASRELTAFSAPSDRLGVAKNAFWLKIIPINAPKIAKYSFCGYAWKFCVCMP